jgi:hypothetical protein
MQLEDLARLIEHQQALSERQHEETRRHFDVSTEGLRQEIQLVAEGVVRLAERLGKAEDSLESVRMEMRTASPRSPR